MQTTTTTDQAAGAPTAEQAKHAAPVDPAPASGGHRLRPRGRRRAPATQAGSTGRGALRTDDLVGRLRSIRATQAGFDGETRMRRLLTAVLLSELVVVIVLAALQSWIGLLVALVATLVVVAAIMVFGPHDEAAHSTGDVLDQVVAGQKEELAAVRQRAVDAESSASLLAELASRHRTLLVRQLTQIDQLEAKEADPGALGELFALDHLATRMRRYAEGVLLLAGREEPRSAGAPVPASEVLRGAVAEVEDFHRVEVSLDRDVEVAADAVVDVVHLLAELIENATVFSSPPTPVRVRGQVTGDAFAVTVTDQGVGMDPQRLADVNQALASGGVPVTPGQVGFPVVARLAARQHVYVGLAATPEGGIEATVVLPAELVGGQGSGASFPAAAPPPPVAPPVAPAATPASAPPAPVSPVPVAPPAVPSAEPVTYAPLPPEPPATTSYAVTATEPVAADPAPVAAPEPPVAAEPEPWAVPVYDPAEAETTAEPASYDGPAEEPSFALPSETPAFEPTAELAYDTSYESVDDPLGIGAADLDAGEEPELAWSMPAGSAPAPDVPAGWSDPAWADAPPAPFVPPAQVEDLAPAPLAPLPEPPPVSLPVPLPEEPVAPMRAPASMHTSLPSAEASQTHAGLARRIPLTNMAPQIAAPDHALADDVAAQPTPDRSRHLFAAYRDGLTLGRGGLDEERLGPDDPQGEVPS
ncbi:MAG TPA: ATP-binding protein [Mycobacteriales bacterium]